MSNPKGHCLKCNTENEYSNIICDACGARLPWAAAVTQAQQVPAKTAPLLPPLKVSLPPGLLPSFAPTPKTQTLSAPQNMSGINTTHAMPMSSVDPFNCIVCQNPNVQKVSALYQSGNWQTTSNTVMVGGGHMFGGNNFATLSGGVTGTSGATQLAQFLAPPVCPKLYTTENWVRFFVGGALAALLTFGLAIPFFAIAGLFMASKQSAAQQQLAVFNRQMPRWTRLYYCSKCDNIYDPMTRQATHPSDMRNFLNAG